MKIRWALFAVLTLLTALSAVRSVGFLRPADTILRVEVAGKGTIEIRLATDQAPKATSQIIRLTRQGFYDGQRWFRVVNTPRPFLIQTGDPQSRDASKLDSESMGTRGSGSKIPFESTTIRATEGAVFLAAKPGDRDSGDSQFFILLGTYKFLEGDHTSFGQVVSGLDVVRRISKGDLITSARIIGGE